MSDHRGFPRVEGTVHTMLEVLPNIIAHLCPSNLRLLRVVNHEFYSLLEAYRAQFNKGLTVLPNEIISDIIQYLSAQDQSCLASVSRRFYSFVIDCILRDDVRYRKSSLFRFSVKKDLKSLTGRLAYRGGDLNTTAGQSRNSSCVANTTLRRGLLQV